MSLTEQVKIELAQRELAKRKLIYFTKYTFPSYQIKPHNRLIADALDLCIDGKIKRLMVFVPPQYGKDININCNIPTPHGFKKMGDLRVGDQVFDENGNVCNVIAKSATWKNKQTYKVIADDGTEVLAGAEHLWKVRLDRKRPIFKLYTTKQLFDRTSQRNPMIKKQGALKLPHKNLLIDPYVLGVWLGDGNSYGGSISQHRCDIGFIRKEIERRGYKVTEHADSVSYGILGLYTQLRKCNLLKNKHIPKEYLRASEQQRLDLLQGLIDTDGYVAPKGQVEFCNKNLDLAKGVQQLVFSLGYKASLKTGTATLNGKNYGVKYRVTFFMPNAAKLPRKANRCHTNSYKPNRYIKIEKSEIADTVCIQVDSPSGMFLCGEGFLPTHNSELVSRKSPPFILGKYPDRKIIMTSYNAGLATTFSREARDLIGTDLYKNIFGEYGTDNDDEIIELSDNSRSIQNWKLAGKRGGVLAQGVGGGITGHGADFGIIDDPIKDEEDARSEKGRDSLWDWYWSTFFTRLSPDAGVVFCMTRWHEDDLAGRLLNQQDDVKEYWYVLRMPALAESPQQIRNWCEKNLITPDRWLTRKRVDELSE